MNDKTIKPGQVWKGRSPVEGTLICELIGPQNNGYWRIRAMGWEVESVLPASWFESARLLYDPDDEEPVELAEGKMVGQKGSGYWWMGDEDGSNADVAELTLWSRGEEPEDGQIGRLIFIPRKEST